MWTVIKQAASDWLRHYDARLGAALAYYSVFSLGPLLLIVVSVAGLFFGGDAVRETLTGQFRALLGPTGSQAVEAMLKGTGSTGSGILSGIVGVVLLLVAALGVVVQLKDALNTIWETKEPESAGVWWYLRTYLISFTGILGLGFLLAVSLVISTVLSGFSSWLGGGKTLVWQAVNFLVSLAVLAALFAMLFQVVSGRRCKLGGRAQRRPRHFAAFQHRQARHWLVRRLPRLGVHLRRGSLDRCAPYLGLLIGSDRLVWRRIDSCAGRSGPAIREASAETAVISTSC